MALKRTLILYGALALLSIPGPGCLAPRRGHDPTLANRLDGILHRLDESGAQFTARVLELPSRRELYAVDIDEPFIPASNMKLPVSAAGLDMFGPEHAFKTQLVLDGDDLWVIGTGDPGLGDARIAERYGGDTHSVLKEWSGALARRGIARIPGNLYYYDGALERTRIHPTWHSDDLVHWYAAPVSGLNFNGNCVDITVVPDAEGLPVRYEIVPDVSGIEVINQCTSTGDDQDGAEPDVSRAANANVYTLSGRCRQRTRLKSKPVTDPGAFFADALRTYLAGQGIAIGGECVPAAAPGGSALFPEEQFVAVHETRLIDILWRINKNSQNLFAECLCKLTGQAYEARRGREVPGSWASGDRAIRDFLRRHKIDDKRLVVADGSGLSEHNCVTARLITDLLAAMHVHRYAGAFKDSLSVAGRDGTLANRMTDLAGHVFAKTGQISGVRALSGYLQKRDGKWLCFSIIYNRIPGSVKPFEELQDEACRLLVGYPNVNAPEASRSSSRLRNAPPRQASRG